MVVLARAVIRQLQLRYLIPRPLRDKGVGFTGNRAGVGGQTIGRLFPIVYLKDRLQDVGGSDISQLASLWINLEDGQLRKKC